MLSNEQIVERFKRDQQEAKSGLSKQYSNTKECQAFYSGDIMKYSDKMQFKTSGTSRKAMVQFNKVKPYVSAVKGFMSQNRREPKYLARMNGDKAQKLYSQYANALHEYVRENANADQTETQQDGDMLINGYGAIETGITYTQGFASSDPNGEILKGRLDPLSVFWDPLARAPNLTDSRYCGYRKEYHLKDAIRLFDDSESDDFEKADPDEDGDYDFYERGGRYDKIKEGADFADEDAELVQVFFYQWVEYETYYRADNPVLKLKNPTAIKLAAVTLDEVAQESEDLDASKDIISFDEETKAKLEETFGDFIDSEPFERKVYYTAVLSGKNVFTSFKSISQNGFSIQFKVGEFDASNKLWVGMVNSMKDPVLYYNKALTELMFIIGANSKGGVMYEKGSVEDIAEFEQKYAKTDASVEVADGALRDGRIQPKRQPFVPSGYENIIQMSDSALNDVNGIDKTFLGSSENRQETGLLQRRRIKQVVSALACYFDAITLYQKIDARITLDYMRIYAENNVGGLFRLLGEQGENIFLEISADQLTNDYDVSIKEAPQSAEEKQEQGNFIAGIADKFLSVGDTQTAKTLYAVALKYSSLEDVDTQQIMQMLQPKNADPAYVAKLEQSMKMLQKQMSELNVNKQKAETAKTVAEIQKLAAETERTARQASTEQAKTGQTMIENRLMQEEGTEVKVIV